MEVGTGLRKLLFTLSLSEQVPEEILILNGVDGGGGVRASARIGEKRRLETLSDKRGVEVRIVACDVGPVPRAVQPGLSRATRHAVVAAARLLAEPLGVSGGRVSRPGWAIPQGCRVLTGRLWSHGY